MSRQPGQHNDNEYARLLVERFVRRFENEAYRQLAMYAGLPLILTPDLLNYLRNQFLRGQLPWEAEADLLLSDLCREVGYEQYAMDARVRAYLLGEMNSSPDGRIRMQQIARVLIQYIGHLWQTNAFKSDTALQTQQLAAMVYLDEHRDKAAQDIVKAFQHASTTSTKAGTPSLSASQQAEMERLANLVRELAGELKSYPELVAYAEDVGRAMAEPAQHSWAGKRTRRVLGAQLVTPELIRGKPARPRKPLPKLPDGWEYIDKERLTAYQDRLDDAWLFHYFDGGSPGWSEALSPHIPRRAMVEELKTILRDAQQRNQTGVTLLTGASGEGKSTVLLQVLSELASKDDTWQIIWRSTGDVPLSKSFLMSLPGSEITYLIAADDADGLAKNMFEGASWLQQSKRYNFQFLLCCDNASRIGERIDELPSRYPTVHFQVRVLRGLPFADAFKIVSAWKSIESSGLGSQFEQSTSTEQAAQRLVDLAKSEKSSEGSFLGALFAVRFGENLKQRLTQTLQRLHLRKAPPKPGGTLLDAFAYIAAMHAENLLFLSKPVLAEVLHCTLLDLQSQVIQPLVAEAMITSGNVILTRHRSIAKAAVGILSNEMLADLGIDDFNDLYAELACAAEEILLKGAPREHVEGFRQLPASLLKNGNVEAGLGAVRALLKRWPSNLVFLVDLAKLYRRAGRLGQATRLFREPERQPYPYDRACYNEWATAEGMAGHIYLDAWLSGVALADDIERSLKLNMAVMALNGLTIAFHRIFQNTNDLLFIEACSAAAQFARKLDHDGRISSPEAWRQVSSCLATCQEHAIQITDTSLAFQQMERGILMAWRQQEEELPKWRWIPAGESLNFTDLARILEIKQRPAQINGALRYGKGVAPAEPSADVFISYHPADQAWVRGDLLPRLDGAGLRYLIEYRDFEIGVHELVNIERAFKRSRHTLIVVTPDWLGSDWGQLVLTLANSADPTNSKRKLLPLILKPARLPAQIAVIHSVDLTDPDERPFEINRLIRQLVEEQKNKETEQVSPPNTSDELLDYKAEQQPWYVAGPPVIKRLARTEALPLISSHPVLLLTVNDNEFFAVGHLLQPLPNQERVVQVSVGNESYYLGRYGAYDAVLVKTRMGAVGPSGTMLVTQRAQDFWKPRATIAVGVAFGMNSSKQQLGDVLIAKEIIPYNPIRAGEVTIEPGQRYASDTALFNRFDNAYAWNFRRPDGKPCRIHKGAVLSGEELIDNADRKAELLRRFPEAIGGEMEGTGLSSASFYNRRPWILIKAICDWADGTKHSQHQPFAAAAAASIVHHVLSAPEALDGT